MLFCYADKHTHGPNKILKTNNKNSCDVMVFKSRFFGFDIMSKYTKDIIKNFCFNIPVNICSAFIFLIHDFDLISFFLETFQYFLRYEPEEKY